MLAQKPRSHVFILMDIVIIREKVKKVLVQLHKHKIQRSA